MIRPTPNPYNNVIFGFKKLWRPMSQEERWRKQAEVEKLSKGAKSRLEWMIFHNTRGNNVSLTCRHFGIAPKTFYKWRNRFDGKNLRLLEERLRAPIKRRSRAITGIQEERIIALRKAHLRWGKMKLAVVYRNTFNEPISSWKIQYTIKKWNLYFHPAKNARLQAQKRRSLAKKRITELARKPFAGHLIALDTVVIYWNNLKRYILTGIDVTAKIAFARMYTTKSSRNAADFLKRMFYLMDGAVLNSLNDNGSEFHKEFITACKELGIEQYWSRKKTPTDNPVDERFNRTLKEEFLAFGNFTPDPLQFNRDLTEWLIEYTFVRPHQALGYQTPWQFYQKVAKVLPMYPSST